MDLAIAAAGEHGVAHGKDPLRGGGAQGPLEAGGIPGWVGPVAAPASVASLQGAQRLLERLLEAATDRHRLAHRLHRRGEQGRAAAEFFEGKAGNLRDHVVDRGFEAGRGCPGDVVDDLVEGVAHRQSGGNFGDGETGGLAGQGRAARDPRIHLDHHHIAVGRVDGELNVAAAGVDADFTNDRDRLVTQALVFAVGEGLGRCHRDRVAGVHPHGVEVLDAAHDHHIVGGVAHHLELKLLPAQQGLLDQDLRDGAGLEAAFAERSEFLGVVGDATAAAAQGEGRSNDAGVTTDVLANTLGFLERVGDA